MIKQTLFKGGHSDGCRDHYSGGEIGLSLDSNKDKWAFIFKEQGGGEWAESY